MDRGCLAIPNGFVSQRGTNLHGVALTILAFPYEIYFLAQPGSMIPDTFGVPAQMGEDQRFQQVSGILGNGWRHRRGHGVIHAVNLSRVHILAGDRTGKHANGEQKVSVLEPLEAVGDKSLAQFVSLAFEIPG